MGAQSDAVASALLHAGANVLLRMQQEQELPVLAITGVEADAAVHDAADVSNIIDEELTATRNKASVTLITCVYRAVLRTAESSPVADFLCMQVHSSCAAMSDL
jgi:hypothetical protein